ncbi:MAG TPA: site-specific integrase [Planctomycetes bacterium]|nr:site-specific integrase [Planctomycetota bacterium]
MRLYKSKYWDKDGKRCTVSKWYVEFYDHTRRLRRLAAFADRRASEQFSRNVDKLVARRVSGAELDPTMSRWVEGLPARIRERLAKIGLLDSCQEAASKFLEKHVEDYEAYLVANGRATKYIKITVSRVRAILEGCRFRCWSDISPDTAHKYLAGLRDGGNGASIETSNQYLRALKQFCNWMVRNGRASESPVAHMQGLNSRTDRRRERRALSRDECSRLIEAARRGPVRYSMRGPERAFLYRLALETGLRASELRSLTKSSFSLDAVPPTVTVEAAHSKHRREDTLPLRLEAVKEIRPYLALKRPGERIFNAPKSLNSTWRTSKMMRADLEAVGIPYVNGTGKVADFHSLRHTFISNLVIGGVHPKVAQTLARHSSITLTMDHYTHVAIEGLVSALGTLPDFSTPEAGESPEAMPATGTNGASALPTRRG